MKSNDHPFIFSTCFILLQGSVGAIPSTHRVSRNPSLSIRTIHSDTCRVILSIQSAQSCLFSSVWSVGGTQIQQQSFWTLDHRNISSSWTWNVSSVSVMHFHNSVWMTNDLTSSRFSIHLSSCLLCTGLLEHTAAHTGQRQVIHCGHVIKFACFWTGTLRKPRQGEHANST